MTGFYKGHYSIGEVTPDHNTLVVKYLKLALLPMNWRPEIRGCAPMRHNANNNTHIATSLLICGTGSSSLAALAFWL